VAEPPPKEAPPRPPFPVTEPELQAYVTAILEVAIVPLMQRLDELEQRLEQREGRDARERNGA
jgi:hypothetical protein